MNITDLRVAYIARVISKPYIQAGLLNYWGMMNGGLVASAVPNQSFNVRVIRDWGLEVTSPRLLNSTPVGTEAYVLRTHELDDLVMSQSRSLQIMISDD